MPSPERPLHVRVAGALGWTELHDCGVRAAHWAGAPPSATETEIRGRSDAPLDCDHSSQRAVSIYVPEYDTDWSATGPLIERYLSDLTLSDWSQVPMEHRTGKHQAYVPGKPEAGWGDTMLIAICNLLLALDAAGKLQTTE